MTKIEFNHVECELPEISATTNDGVRLYETPEGNLYPSITTVLSVKNKQGLSEWRQRVGNEVANYVLARPHVEEPPYIICAKIFLTICTLIFPQNGKNIQRTSFRTVYLHN